jgi:hypothetical protein
VLVAVVCLFVGWDVFVGVSGVCVCSCCCCFGCCFIYVFKIVFVYITIIIITIIIIIIIIMLNSFVMSISVICCSSIGGAGWDYYSKLFISHL